MANIGSPSPLITPPPPMPAGGATQPADSVPLRDIPDPVQIPTGWLWFWILLGALAVAAIIWALVRRLKNPKPKLVPFIPPHRWARDRLRGATELISDPYAFCSLVSDVLRQYLEQRFSLHAPDRTTEEFLEELRRSPALTGDHKGLLENFLRQCDLVKFARMEPAEPDLRALLDAALKLVDETQAIPPPSPTLADPVQQRALQSPNPPSPEGERK